MLNHLPRSGMSFLLHIFNLFWSLHFFPSIWKISFIILNTSFYRVYSSFWNLTPFSLPIRPVCVMDGLFLIKFFIFLSPYCPLIFFTRYLSISINLFFTLRPFLDLSQSILNDKPRPGSRTILATINFSKAFDSCLASRPFPLTYFSWPPSLLCSLDSIFPF